LVPYVPTVALASDRSAVDSMSGDGEFNARPRAEVGAASPC
jgi:hypothetical protein